MATLTKPKVNHGPSSSTALDSGVPTPFPKELLATFGTEDQSERVGSVDADNAVESNPPNLVEQTQHLVALKDVMPSIVHVQRSCLMTLNNLLSEPKAWHPILPDRRHSMPSSAQAKDLVPPDSSSSPNSALQTLLTNLRNHEAGGEMIETRPHDTDSDRLREVQRRVQSISSSLPPTDAALAKALVSLLSDLYRLAEIQSIATQPSSTSGRLSDIDTHSILEAPPPADIFDALTRQLGDLQIERISSQAAEQLPGASPLLVVENAVVWARVDAELENVMSLCRQRTETLPKFSTQHHKEDHLPPEYDHDVHGYRHHDHDDMESLPDYDGTGRSSFDDSKSHKLNHHQHHDLGAISTRTADEKMRMDLESVTMAIDRLYLVAPQLHNQRVELKSSKVEQLEKARREGSTPSSSSASGSRTREDPDVKDLENILKLLTKASERSMKDQSVILDSRMQSRIEERTKQREKSKRDALLSSLIEHSEAGRLHDQDAVLKLKDPEALLSLPEFIRESMPMSERLKDPQALLSLPEFVREPIPTAILEKEHVPPPIPEKGKKKRHRSLSAPPLAWLRSREGRSQNGSSSGSKGKGKVHNSDKTAFDVVYVAENHENLHHVLVFFTVTGGRAGADIQAEVLPPLIGKPDEGDHLIIKAGPHTSLPLLLPAHTTPGKKQVQKQGGHWVIKLSTVASPSPSSSSSSSSSSSGAEAGRPETPISSAAINGALLDATQLSSLNPSSFLCASCSLPLVLSSKVDDYRDLPSEHWQELVEAWMCHSDLKLNEQVADRGKQGFWPARASQGLVGGSYILFDEGAMSGQNLLLGEADDKSIENWHLARCICGAIIGRWQDRTVEQTKENARTFRVLKYAVRPVSQTSEPSKIPLSAFIVNDMLEYVQAHATYRFVIRDEEEERARILIWLFKPKIRLAYTTPLSRAIPKSASILGAKVLYKLLKPSDDDAPFDLKAVLNKYPGFPQAEYLSYPMPICRRIAGMLKESSTAYPENLRTMTGLEVGWLQRV